MPKTYAEYKTEQRKQPAAGNPLDEYDPETSARVAEHPANGWPPCTCPSCTGGAA
ncbi:hypothetical protein OG455_00600 [Kitasatospora sp. NBC_01287]|uniref:hypothetical protein n=1 Tax=Kitasatospora sp. NBC_01287 TaxID=2903573 RepID=UPI00225094BE|nr:hypothetical protein [Kitasatospora sp. NBC_01287]MCX4744025.1 hypothetical protein [Kitasatospora sp. NBC_01287]